MDTKENKLFGKIEHFIRHRQLKGYYNQLQKIKSVDIETWDQDQIKQKTLVLMKAVRNGNNLDECITEVFALAYEAVRRVMGIHLFDEQIVAGLALYDGKLVEMKTGEGKTLSGVLSAYAHALSGKGVHVFTFNDYLAHRDAEWMRPVYEFLGMTVGFIQEGMEIPTRKQAYSCDITYVTAKEAGFDFLKDSQVCDVKDCVQRPFYAVIVDEADSILIDKARVPLILAGEMETEVDRQREMALIAKQLTYKIHFDTDEYKRNIFLTESGEKEVENRLSCGNLFDLENAHLLTAVICAIHAEDFFKKDVDYIIRDGKVELVDEFTGRVADNRRWPDGLQSAVEAKEGLNIQPSGKILATITLQHYLSLYPKISGMTATVLSSVTEFKEIYGLHVVVIPLHLACQRINHPPIVFTHKEAKLRALVEEVASVHPAGRPILIGTASVEESDQLAGRLQHEGITCHLLNAKNDEEEAEIIAKAGVLGAVTVSTNMAGRGVDIRLGGGQAEQYEKVKQLGGLYVIGTHLHESIRVDHQLRGRAGRQGDPGASRFYVSLEDDLLQRFGIENAVPAEFVTKRQEEPLDSAVIRQRIGHIQRVIEGQNFGIRSTLSKYSDIVEEDRKIISQKRWNILIDVTECTLLETKETLLYEQLCEIHGKRKVKEIEKQITLFAIDNSWSDYLDYVAYIREGIHLERIGRNNPLDQFHRRVAEAFDDLPSIIDKNILEMFHTMEISKNGVDLDYGVKRPSATGTYIVNDNFIQNRISLI